MQRLSGKKTLLLSVDLDMWYHCRWATGGPKSMWHTTESAIHALYGDAGPARINKDLTELADRILELLRSFNFTATFFVLGEIARCYPNVIKRIISEGHEIASHGMHHEDASRFDDARLRASVGDSKKILEDISGQLVQGFRYPNLVFTKRELAALVDHGFRYDSSTCFSRRMFGKFGVNDRMIQNPYHPDIDRPFRQGESEIWEFPIPVFPVLRLPAGSGIATRLMGVFWSKFALNAALRTGDTLYYFHPFDLHHVEGLGRTSLNAYFFLQNAGAPFERQLTRLLRYYAKRVNVMCIRDWLRDRERSA